MGHNEEHFPGDSLPKHEITDINPLGSWLRDTQGGGKLITQQERRFSSNPTFKLSVLQVAWKHESRTNKERTLSWPYWIDLSPTGIGSTSSLIILICTSLELLLTIILSCLLFTLIRRRTISNPKKLDLSALEIYGWNLRILTELLVIAGIIKTTETYDKFNYILDYLWSCGKKEFGNPTKAITNVKETI
ncbi:unnamed protein product [Vicia faba]|uniref:Uncharacterized protein n=1 Tax=Vicia faba TaxID=3906 RepID=A0AAV0Z3Y0_VICFA|nr:unnamed protein product [Vicia faba]